MSKWWTVTLFDVGRELPHPDYVAQLEAELKAHRDNEGGECPVCVLEEENERLAETINSWIEDGESVPTSRVSVPVGVLRLWRDALKKGE